MIRINVYELLCGNGTSKREETGPSSGELKKRS